ncbi:DUF1156 domain-containing protein [Sorangium sp. So ce693]|uniref:DUF1156 domain-containing protein n=1 Tax=Sorangium sp. So ce693 TaxID=3133318 RepID=UPI003F5FB4B4
MRTTYRKKLIEVALPLEAINAASAREKSIRHGHPSTLHLWWARRPLAAARAVLFAQLVDDPSSWPELFPTEETQNHERQRLFRLIEDLVQWENSSDEEIINAARLEIARSHARSSNSPKAKAVLKEGVKPSVVNEYLATELPPVHDPFAGGGSIPLEAQRLGLRAIASDLNPVAVMINKALIEIPPKFAGIAPVNPEARANGKLRTWRGAEGLAEDVRYYGAWMREQAKKQIGHLYPDAQLPKEHGGGKAKVIAWIWARTVACPNPACGVHAPLLKSFRLSGKGDGVVATLSRSPRRIMFRIDGKSSPEGGTVDRRGAKCIACGATIPLDHVRAEASAGRMGAQLVAQVVEGAKKRVYLAPDERAEQAALCAKETYWEPNADLPHEALGFRVQRYGMRSYGALFSKRQLVALSCFSRLTGEVAREARAAGASEEYARALATYLAFAVDKAANYWSTLCSWYVNKEIMVSTFGLPTLSMVWDYAEANPFSDSSGNWLVGVAQAAEALEGLVLSVTPGVARQADVSQAFAAGDVAIVQSDPPYYDNIGYANLSDFFYVWLRRSLSSFWGDVFHTVLTPKTDELIAEPGRFNGDREAATRFFENGLQRAFTVLRQHATSDCPIAIYYAFKQQEVESDDTSSTGAAVASSGWDKMLSALLGAGFQVDGTWPVRTEQPGGLREARRNALASSIVLVCRSRPQEGASTTRGEFRRMLRKELPDALKKLQQGNIAPVDVAQASIGPGMAIFSRHKAVLEADGSPMTVRAALQLINEVLDEYLASGEGDFDADTRFAITWYEQHGWAAGSFGEAETLAKARNVSVSGVVEAGICHSAAGKVRILKRPEMRPLDYDPTKDERPTIWEFTQHMIRVLEDEGEEAAARLLKKLGSAADATRELAYRLYNTCERKKWSEDARAYNGLILAWPELEKLSATLGDGPLPAAPSEGGKKAAKTKKAPKAQTRLFQGDDDA